MAPGPQVPSGLDHPSRARRSEGDVARDDRGGVVVPSKASAPGELSRPRGAHAERGLELDAPIPHGGYRWVYIDGASDDGQQAIVVIAMLGSPFSPWYFRARARTPHAADPLRFASFNAAVYGARASRWALFETSRVERAPEAVRIGDSMLARDGARFTVNIDAPRPRSGAVRGRVRVDALGWSGDEVAIDVGGHHAWRTFAPRARVEVDLDEPRVRWSGWGYVDGNSGDEPLERSLRGWSWSRSHFRDGRTLVSYETEVRGGGATSVARIMDPGGASRVVALCEAGLPRTRWGLARSARAGAAAGVKVLRSLEDTPFYARSLVEVTAEGEATSGMHETLSLDRFASPWVRAMLPYRIRREADR